MPYTAQEDMSELCKKCGHFAIIVNEDGWRMCAKCKEVYFRQEDTALLQLIPGVNDGTEIDISSGCNSDRHNDFECINDFDRENRLRGVVSAFPYLLAFFLIAITLTFQCLKK